ncbi:MAG: hypothetical protein H5U08_02525 [Thermogutta sp.]|uniref:hypothetical protein n=1 Tax=Thermogutta sp. TaxID=1962930 RepID=UPI0019AAE7CA|nr:hypothetical protein [Thermogutta sp.]MBC7351207.1 hypothetical protein [Thermogutta sp.]
MDRAIQNILDPLDRWAPADRALVIFIGDNGLQKREVTGRFVMEKEPCGEADSAFQRVSAGRPICRQAV